MLAICSSGSIWQKRSAEPLVEFISTRTNIAALKEFRWAGYDVSITIPGKDHLMLQEFNLPAYSYKKRAKMKGMGEADVAEWLKQKIKRGLT